MSQIAVFFLIFLAIGLAIAPGFLDWLSVKMFLEPIIRRAKAAQIEVKS
jgi:hypothetical protein